MNAPGDPLEFFEDNPAYGRALAHYQAQGFGELDQDVTEAIANARWSDPQRLQRKGELRRIWSRRTLHGLHQQGLLGMVESKDRRGRTAVFQFLCVSGNDIRSLYALTLGVFTKEALRQFCADYDATSEKGGNP